MWANPLIFQYNVSISFFATRGKSGFVVLKTLTLLKPLAMFAVFTYSSITSSLGSNPFVENFLTSFKNWAS
jgi:hypothetical protein